MTTASVTDEVVEVIDESESITVVVSAGDSVPVSVKSGDFATVLVQDEAVTLLVNEPGAGSGGNGAIAMLDDIGNVTEAGRLQGSVLEYNPEAGTWQPTNGQRNQIYDGGHF